MSAQATAPFDKIADRYDRSRGGEERGEQFAGVMDELLGDGPLLELGVGTALVGGALARRGRDVCGVDVSAGMLGYARDRLPGRIALADVCRLPFKDASFAGCYAVWMLHLASDVPTALAAVRRVLRPGGRLVVVPANNRPREDAIGQLVYAMQVRLLGERSDKGGAGELLRLAEKCGFTQTDRRDLPQTYQHAPAAMAREIERRNFSSLQDVGETEWREIVQPTIDALRALPEAEVPRDRTTVHEAIVLEPAP
ncbi:class I SAM-dependent methyltransferase [Streptomyces iconiensis]|uniref:Methyltransferase domain-containing protein n=1 Tax=Streptomyces iconiensis TaxID=1384038 RepID=A0ABT6ZZJ3_9ACTN|nr:class I SAM-dependent methyltransferase [Streptomyces iconiensis]MDJ1134475.1 methyltransferase domain-containing protein [Streptomyces iconiensis]